MKKQVLNNTALIVIIIFASCLYLYKLNIVPNGFYVDEATVAYNAKAILETGKDEYGVFYPIYFRLLGSYTPSLYIYLLAALIKVFGSSIFVARFISVVSASVSIYFFYLLITKLKLYKFQLTYFALTLFYAISPWILFNARVGYETTLGYLVFNIGIYYLYLASKRIEKLPVALLFLSLSTYISHNQRFLVPLFLLFYFVVFRKYLLKKKNNKFLWSAMLIGFISQIPNLLMIGTKAFWIKGAQFDLGNFLTILVYLSPKTLFYQNPDIDMQHVLPKVSMMFNWMAVPCLVGIYLLIKRYKTREGKFVLLYAILSLVPSLFSSQFVSSQRSLVFIVPLAIVIGMGIDELSRYLKPILRSMIFILILGYSITMVYSSYYILFPKEGAIGWNYGYEHIAKYIKQRPDSKFIIDNSRNPRSYILLLYFLDVPPGEYQKTIDPRYKDNYYQALPPASSYHFANVEIRQLNWETDPLEGLIIIGDPLSVSSEQAREHKLLVLEEFKDPLNNTTFTAYKSATFDE